MDLEISVSALPVYGTCTLCLNYSEVKSMLGSYMHNGSSEFYSDMLIKCFAIDISTFMLGDTKRLICNSCISKLRDTITFREQVEHSLKNLEQAFGKEDLKKLLTNVKQEVSQIDDDDHFADQIDDEDDIALNELVVKKEDLLDACSRKTRKRLGTSKKKIIKLSLRPPPAPEDLQETESMLLLGLFPFKMRKNNMYVCALCSESSHNLDIIKSHVSEHGTANIHVAFKKMMFSNSQRFYKYTTKLRCKMCTTDISNFDELKQHIDNCTRIKYTCKWSNLPFRLEKDQLDCPVCKKTFINFVNLNTHMNIHYPNYICESCGKAFASKARLRGHMRTHEVGDFPCRYCPAVFDRVTKRENHVCKEHKSGVRYACKRCNISLPSFYARQKHLAEVHNEELKRYKCKVCPQSYITPGHLSSHVRRDHLNERNHKCTKCDLAFYTKNALNMHMIKHDGERIHICSICQKSYQRKKTLREHMRIHTNDKRFVCPVCGRAFTQKCTLKGHLRVHERKVDLDDRIMQPMHSI